MIKLIPVRFQKSYCSASCFLALIGCKPTHQNLVQHNYIVGERNKGDLFYNSLLDVSIDIPENVSYEDLSKLNKSTLRKSIGDFKDISSAKAILSYKTNQNLESYYFFEKIEKPIDTITHEKLVRNDSINGIIIFEKQKGAKKVISLTRMPVNTNHLEKANENIRRVHLDSTSLNKLSYMHLFNYYTYEPHKNYLQGRDKIKLAPIKDPKKIMFKDPLYLTINSYIGNNKEYNLLIKKYESDKSNFNHTVLNSLSKNEVKKEEAVIAAIADLANNNQIIILNEDHFYPKHRLFALNLLDVLKQKGFTVISMETFTPNYGTNTAPIPNAKNGFYIKDPYFGHFVRKANAMGFTLVGHENADQKIDREIGQAKNVMKILEKDPKAKIFIYVGHGHLEENGKKRFMANYLKEYSNIDPVTINQETVMMNTKEKLILLPKAVFAKDTLMKSSADYFVINNLEANLQSVYPDKTFKKVSLKDLRFSQFKNEELLVDVFLLEEYNATKNADLLIPLQSTLIVQKDGKIETDLPIGEYYITVKSANNDLFQFNRIEVN
ncbi:hypothetical protein [Flavobacterium collinsii]|uniref:Uncharacterized protein n=1 Tax=Flavobacterium collinsii TaxID=1114861 RepID=A0A9W4TIP2_9FLAO|nr:hypothetical protein [Flavobacterium collinsii]CAI2768277.1 conserved protein of unknown function [Flavobacterium collinsii]